MSHRERLVTLTATSPGGTVIRTGPFDIGEALLFVDEHLVPGGWQPRFATLTPVDEAIEVFAVGRDRAPELPGPERDLFVAIRRATVCDPEFDGAECPRRAALLAHLEAHRPMYLCLGDEEHRLQECECDIPDGGVCPTLRPAGALCRQCSAVYDSGSEYGTEWLDACRVPWPCPPLAAVAAHYDITLPTVAGAAAW